MMPLVGVSIVYLVGGRLQGMKGWCFYRKFYYDFYMDKYLYKIAYNSNLMICYGVKYTTEILVSETIQGQTRLHHGSRSQQTT